MTTALSRSRTEAAPGAANGKRASSPRAARVRRGKLARRIVMALLALGIVLALGLAFRPRPLEVEVVAAGRGDLVVTVDEMAKTRVRDRYVVSAPIGGNLMRIELRAGDEVRAGSVLARIVPMQPVLLDPRSRSEAQARVSVSLAGERQAEAAVARAELAEAHAADELVRTRRLVEGGSLPSDALVRAELEARLRKEELASARFAEQMAANEVTMARTALRRFEPSATPSDSFEVTSPAFGRVLRIPTQSAGPVQPGTPLVEVGDPGALEIVADILTADAVRMKPGAPVTVERWGGDPLPAHVRRVEPSAFTRLSALGVEEQRVPVVIDLDAPHERTAALGDGFRVEVRVVVAERHDVVHVPLAAVFRRGDGWALYVARDERARIVPVKLGVRSDTAVEIEEGLAAGDRVLVHPGERVADGVRIAPRAAQ